MNGHGRKSLALALLLIPLLLINTGCDMPLFAEPTLTPTVTDTPTPSSTNTPLPTNTRTATPNLLATQQANRENTIRNLLTTFELPTESGEIGWFQDYAINIKLNGTEGFYQKFAEDVVAGDFVLYTRMTWDTDTWPSCGVIFRSDERWRYGDYYVLRFWRISGLPAFDIEYVRDGYYASTVTEDYRFSSYLDLDDGSTNEIVLSAIDNEFKVFINGTFEGRYYDYSDKLAEGMFAFVATQSSGKTTCSFDNSWVWMYK